MEYVNRLDGRYRGYQVVLRLAWAFWAPGSVDEFKHIAKDKFDDPTARFALLTNMLPDGSFLTPRNIAHNLVRLKYCMRALLYKWSRVFQEESNAPISM